ncbi:MAG: Uncharacterised protein [Cryomorphaceae bacterium]|nr:MAG: Uncharacterised protein [Cryomorphaceae bacterium]|tara:strand:+ start:524 stop:991 length:468 start_codon:yes stop_codon:yes gene_type:complete
MKFPKKSPTFYSGKMPKNDYLKYWKVVKQWARAKYNLTTADIEMMLFIYSEGLFTKEEFNEFNEIMSWDKNRFHKMVNDKWIIKWRERKGKESTLYELGFKGKRVCNSIYRKLNKEESISEDRKRNPMFKQTTEYSNKVYRKMIKKMNQERKDLS